MRLLVISDVHLEFGPFRLSEPMPEFEVAVFAGDMHKPIVAAIDWMADQRVAGPLRGREIVYVAGNHEFYNSEMKGNLVAGAEQAEAAGIRMSTGIERIGGSIPSASSKFERGTPTSADNSNASIVASGTYQPFT